MNFYNQCKELREFYLKTFPGSLHVTLLSKLVSIAFYNTTTCLDELPKDTNLFINCSDILTNANDIEQALYQVLSDLNFQRTYVKQDKLFYVSHNIMFIILD